MLIKLSVSNFVLIRQLEIIFGPGLTVITGETGAGKSILLGALSLILGQRADSASLLDTDNKCIVEGTFNLSGLNLEAFFSENNLDYDHQSIVRREITPAGKSRSFINDTPVQLSLLKELGEQIINIHSQRQTAEVRNQDFQAAIFDNYAGATKILQDYTVEYNLWNRKKTRLEEMKKEHLKAEKEKDYIRFQRDELLSARLMYDETAELENEFRLLSHTDEIKSGVNLSIQCLETDDHNVLNDLIAAQNALKPIARYDNQISELISRLHDIYIDIKDITDSLRNLDDKLISDPERLSMISDRLNLIHKLLHKHQVSSVSELIILRDELSKKLEAMNQSVDEIEALEIVISQIETVLWEMAARLSNIRKNAVIPFSEKVAGIMKQVGIPEAVFNVEMRSTGKLGAKGTDEVNFLFSSGKSLEAKELAKIASGGELSRITLALKSLVSQKNLLPSIIFDEIDTGVSGEIAGKVGNILLEMASGMQVIAITHLPQIAARGNRHFLVSKVRTGQGAETVISELNPDERVTVIARMISDETVTEAALDTARELLGTIKNSQTRKM